MKTNSVAISQEEMKIQQKASPGISSDFPNNPLVPIYTHLSHSYPGWREELKGF